MFCKILRLDFQIKEAMITAVICEYTGYWPHFKGNRLTDPLLLLIDLRESWEKQFKETAFFITSEP